MTAEPQLETVLDKFRQISNSKRERGTLFEKLARQILRCSPQYRDKYDYVALWSDWPGRNSLQDCGIDMVARGVDGRWTAIQCKFYDEKSKNKVDKDDVDSFVAAASGTYSFEGESVYFSRAVVFTTAPLSKLAQAELENLALKGAEKGEKSGSVVLVKYLSELGLDQEEFWRDFDANFIDENADETDLDAKRVALPPKELRPYQLEALADVEEGFRTNERGKLIMACGTGKTLTSLRIVEKLTPNAGRVLYLVPSLALLAQTLREWTIDAKRRLFPIVVCSDSEIHEQDSRRQGALKKDVAANADSDDAKFEAVFLTEPATTRPDTLAERLRQIEKVVAEKYPDALVVAFSTYQSIQTVIDAQQICGAPAFFLAVCDEAHRTTGTKGVSSRDESAFVRVHNSSLLAAQKRLYMTATPKIYGVKDVEKIKSRVKKADPDADESQIVCSMDDESVYGPTFYTLGFKKAVEEGLLTDYKVAILVVDEDDARESLGRIGTVDGTAELDFDDKAKLLGCWRGLSKRGKYKLADGIERNDFEADPEPVKRAVAYAKTIKISKALQRYFAHLARSAKADENATPEILELVDLETDHIDGEMGAAVRKTKLDWLKAEPPKNVCRVLSNVRCLSEGVDCPSLDAILFTSPRNSKIDAIQSVGRVMRRSPGKKYGYVFIPIVVPSNVEPEDALDSNERYRVVWEVLQALRSHDESLYISVNQLGIDGKPSKDGKVQIFRTGGSPTAEEEPGEKVDVPDATQSEFPEIEDYRRNQKLVKALCAKIAKKCGDRKYLDVWAFETAAIAKRFLERLQAAFQNTTPAQAEALKHFKRRLKYAVNMELSEEEILESIKQHFVSKPVFDALFPDGAKFSESNVVAREFQTLINSFSAEFTNEERRTFAALEDEIALYVRQIETKRGRSEILKNYYEKFFKVVDPKAAERLGVVYTPTEIVDFILRSVDFIVRKEFKKRSGLSSPTVRILDPFVGTGTFVARLISGDFINPKSLTRKFSKELFANEIVLLAYYVAAANIESEFAERCGGKRRPFPGIVLTDTFNSDAFSAVDRTRQAIPSLFDATPEIADEIIEREIAAADRKRRESLPLFGSTSEIVDEIAEQELAADAKADNIERLEKQRHSVVEIIVGNPPYSVGQKSGNDNNQNRKYDKLDKRVAATYAAASSATLKNSLYDSYVKAFRWASDRIPEDCGVVAFVTNGAFIDNAAFDGFRKTLVEEFTSVYVFNLRGDQRTQGETSRKEGGKIFGSGSRAPIAITVLVKNKRRAADGFIRYCNVGDYKTREEKLHIVEEMRSVERVFTAADARTDAETTAPPLPAWEEITPDENGDWINHRDDSFQNLFILGDKKAESNNEQNTKTNPPSAGGLTFFEPIYTAGVKTNRDAWCYNFSRHNLVENMGRTTDFYNAQVDAYAIIQGVKPEIIDFVDSDPTKISWTRGLRTSCKTQKYFNENIDACIKKSAYRPFNCEFLFVDRLFTEIPGQTLRFFPGVTTKNKLICVPGPGSKKEVYAPLIIDKIPCYDIVEKSQCFPQYYYVPVAEAGPLSGSETVVDGCVRRDAITDAIYSRARALYGDAVRKEDIFYYVYGALHATDYRTRYEADLRKGLPRLPLVESPELFWRFSDAGRELANLHLNYDGIENGTPICRRDGTPFAEVAPFPEIVVDVKEPKTGAALTDAERYRVAKIKWATRKETREEAVARAERQGKDPATEKPKSVDDKTTLIYNDYVVLRNIPLDATRYIVNGRSPLDWIIERYQVKVDKESGIVNDPNDWAPENPRYIVDLIRRLTTVGVETTRIIADLPNLLD